MLTEGCALAAVVSTFTGRVRRLILVGDPAQLPPIGPGRPLQTSSRILTRSSNSTTRIPMRLLPDAPLLPASVMKYGTSKALHPTRYG